MYAFDCFPTKITGNKTHHKYPHTMHTLTFAMLYLHNNKKLNETLSLFDLMI